MLDYSVSSQITQAHHW